MVVGCDLTRGQAIIRTRLGPWTPVRFLIVDYKHGRKMEPVAAPPDTIILRYDAKYDAIATTPRFRGIVIAPPAEEEELALSDICEDEWEWN